MIVHGDYRLGNLMFAPEAPDLLAILDWELSTIGHPLADLAYLCSFFRLPHDGAPFRGLGGLDLAALGIPDEAAVVARYCAGVGARLSAAELEFLPGVFSVPVGGDRAGGL